MSEQLDDFFRECSSGLRPAIDHNPQMVEHSSDVYSREYDVPDKMAQTAFAPHGMAKAEPRAAQRSPRTIRDSPTGRMFRRSFERVDAERGLLPGTPPTPPALFDPFVEPVDPPNGIGTVGVGDAVRPRPRIRASDGRRLPRIRRPWHCGCICPRSYFFAAVFLAGRTCHDRNCDGLAARCVV